MTSQPSTNDGGPFRPASQRPTPGQLIGRTLSITAVVAIALFITSWLLPDFQINRFRDALLAGLVMGLFNALVWPALSFVLVPLSVYTLGAANLVVNALLTWAVLDSLPGVRVDGFWAAMLVALIATVIATLLATALALDDDAWYDQRMARFARRRRGTTTSEVPGVVFVQIDGLSEPVLRVALASGDVPTLHRWLDDGQHHIVGWRTEWSSQTGVSQCGILHGSTVDMPAFRWVEKDTGEVIVSNHPKSAAEIERRHSDGAGLLAHNGSSYGNLFTGDAGRAVLTMSVAGTKKEGRAGKGYGQYFSRPSNAIRTLVGSFAEIVRERRAQRDQMRRNVEPRVSRNWTYSLLRAFTTIISRDVCVNGVINDMAEGRAAIYIDFLGYDEVSHHSGPLREDTLRVLRDIDRQIARFERAARWSPRPYRIVVLSDHGQTQGATFDERYDESLAELVGRLCGSVRDADSDSEEGRTESSAWFRSARGQRKAAHASEAKPTVLASGNLGLIYLPEGDARLTQEEIAGSYPKLIRGLVEHPGVGFVLVRSAAEGSLVLGASGRRNLDTGEVEGDDPLGPFGPEAIVMVTKASGYSNAADVMVNSLFDAERNEVAAFEHQVSSHGGLGGPQTRPFLLYPATLAAPDGTIEGPAALHFVLKGWLADLGQPVGASDAGE